MTTLTIRLAEDLGWIAVGRAVADDVREKFGEADERSDIRVHHRGSDTDLQLFEVRVPPDCATSRHAHTEDEIMYVLAGEVRFGSQVLTPGSSAYVPGGQLYSFRTGPEGATFLNFRPRFDGSFISSEEYMVNRRGGVDAPSADT